MVPVGFAGSIGVKRVPRNLTTAVLFAMLVLVAATPDAIAVPGDGAIASYGLGAGSGAYNAMIKNTGTTWQLFDYVQAPPGISVTGCAPSSGFPAGTTCTPNEAGPRTAEVNIPSPGLAPGHTGVFSFTTASPIVCGAGAGLPQGQCPRLFGAINSTGNPTDYFQISFDPPGPPPPPNIFSQSFSISVQALVDLHGDGLFGSFFLETSEQIRVNLTYRYLAGSQRRTSGSRFSGPRGKSAGAPVGLAIKRKRTSPVIVGSLMATIPPGKTVSLPLKLSKKGLTLLKRLKKLPVTITITLTSKSGAHKTLSRTVKLKARNK